MIWPHRPALPFHMTMRGCEKSARLNYIRRIRGGADLEAYMLSFIVNTLSKQLLQSPVIIAFKGGNRPESVSRLSGQWGPKSSPCLLVFYLVLLVVYS